jgi:hypothetical protein
MVEIYGHFLLLYNLYVHEKKKKVIANWNLENITITNKNSRPQQFKAVN